MFYGQHAYFTLARWQEAEGFHEVGKCKEFSSILDPLSSIFVSWYHVLMMAYWCARLDDEHDNE
jgi:hypothetical protein